MPELPDISAYITALESRIVGEPIEHVRLATPFLLRTVEPPIASVEGRRVCELPRIGNAYSDEILHAAQLTPIMLTRKLSPSEWEKLFAATRSTLQRWIDQLQTEASTKFPEKVTAFRKDMAVHGRYGQRCPLCGEAIQRIRYADNETNYCARCQTGARCWRIAVFPAS